MESAAGEEKEQKRESNRGIVMGDDEWNGGNGKRED